jgi:hypothetical protein
MKLPRDVSGEHLAGILCRRWHYRKVHQSGSHIIVEAEDPSHLRHTSASRCPNHDTLRIGTFHSALKAVASRKGVTREAVAARL